MMEMGGTVADAAVATLFCEGVSMPAFSGLGGGFIMMIYMNKEDVMVLNSLGYAPAKADKNMFKSTKGPIKGPSSILVPGELRGYGELHRRYGKLYWADLIQPSIDLCKQGVVLTEFHRKILLAHIDTIKKSTYLKNVFMKPLKDEILDVGDKFIQPVMAKTLELIADEGPDTMYNGSLAKKILTDVPGILVTEDDLQSFNVKWQTPIRSLLKSDHLLFVPGIPASGTLITFCLKILRSFITPNPFSPTNWSYIIEAFKFMMAKQRYLEDSDEGVIASHHVTSELHVRKTLVKIKPNITHTNYEFYEGQYFVEPKTSHTTHVSILSAYGNGISVTSTINSIFGSGVVSESTGIILNDDMNDFVTRPTKDGQDSWEIYNNTIAPHKIPLHAVCPVLILNRDLSVRMVMGATGGLRILTSIVLIIIKHLFFEMELKTAIDEYRIHHQLIPMILYVDELHKKSYKKLVKFYEDLGHNITYFQSEGLDIVTVVANTSDMGIIGYSDIRREGEDTAYFIH